MEQIKEENILTQGFAQKRKKMISWVHYDLNLSLKEGMKTYQGQVKIRFVFYPTSEKFLKIDFITHKIKKILVNGAPLTGIKKSDFAIHISTESLARGANNLEIEYTNQFDSTGSGFHKFQDPIDKKEYMHTDFEPFDAHRLFPCFDQPDIKATFQLTVTGPLSWRYIHNTKAGKKLNIKTKGNKEKYQEIIFNQTQKFSTYLFALVVGPYAKWTDEAGSTALGIYCRKSLAKFIDPENIFEVTKESFSFLEKYFDYPYPYDKYDQVFVPEFNFGAMENVGCVTFTERYIFRQKVLYKDFLNRANTIAHEMVHMWFGNLVTMKWWNDLWLNESFADYLSYYALSSGELYPDALEHFFARKEWAYQQDQHSTTHPVAASAKDTVEAFSSFDGISYSKGASVLRQLQYHIGNELFRRSIQLYFKKYAEDNTTLDDFLKIFSEVTKTDIVSWSKKWLETTGVNTLVPVVENHSLFVEQKPSQKNNLLREHSLEYTGYQNKPKSVVKTEREKITLSAKKNEFKLKNTKTDFVVLNTNDYDYTKVFLPDSMIPGIGDAAQSIKEPFTRRNIWGSLWQMVRDNAFSPLGFLEAFYSSGYKEKDPSILQSHLVSKVMNISVSYLTDENRGLWLPKLNELSLKLLNDPEQEESQKIIWFDLLLYSSESENELNLLFKILKGKERITNLTIDQEKRWNIIVRLIAYGFEDALALLHQEKKRDKSDLGMKRAFQAEVSVPDAGSKKIHWETFIGKDLLSTDYLRYGMEKFHSFNQREILGPFVDKYLQILPEIYSRGNFHFSGAFGNYLFPRWDRSRELLDKIKKILNEKKKGPALMIKFLKESRDNLERVIPILEKQKK